MNDLKLIAEKSIFFLDLDGTIYLGNEIFSGVIELLDLLRMKDKKFYFLSNNSSYSTKDYVKKLNNLDINVDSENIILSQHPTIAYLKSKNFKKIFLLGTQSLKEEFLEHGFILTPDNPEIVVLAFDKELTYERLVIASNLLQQNTPYIATHLDNRCPTEDGYIPDAGGIASLLHKTVERMPRVFGKPNKEMILYKLKEISANPEDAVYYDENRQFARVQIGIRRGDHCPKTTFEYFRGDKDWFLHQVLVDGFEEMNLYGDMTSLIEFEND